ncbi:Cof-type HAD-IIB family hydrolase [Lacticaseibacillus paracasei]|uniref:Cof-type HAD-IIB family hydrolase n=1 Tax=Lacticaseibacillus paracasei TaxID=1597 RepID=UPI0021D3E444|nr:Cof-type HAD-IIB family hydrolase [Lacticaseibacillus paracasei]MCU6430241.1 Cof-type HAD-IIB family hydrolase [Lacticaseibacillus paracasei]
MRYRLILSDIDGTLLNSQHQLTDGVKTAIQDYAIAGGTFVLASARPPLAMTALAHQMGLDVPLVSLNGAVICQPQQDELKILSATAWPDDVGSEVYQALSQLTLSLNVFSEAHWYVNTLDLWTQQEAAITGFSPEPVAVTAMLAEGLPVHKMLCMGEPDVVDQAEAIILAHPEWQLVASRSKRTYLEIVRQGVSKESALRQLSELFNIPMTETMALGDGENDLPMLKTAALGVTLANGLPVVLDAIKTVVPDNNHDGAAVAIRKYALAEA